MLNSNRLCPASLPKAWRNIATSYRRIRKLMQACLCMLMVQPRPQVNPVVYLPSLTRVPRTLPKRPAPDFARCIISSAIAACKFIHFISRPKYTARIFDSHCPTRGIPCGLKHRALSVTPLIERDILCPAPTFIQILRRYRPLK
jgi:hypothetical protein